MYKGFEFDQSIAYVAVCYQLGVVLVPKLCLVRLVESCAGNDGDSSLMEIRFLLSSCQGKVHLNRTYT